MTPSVKIPVSCRTGSENFEILAKADLENYEETLYRYELTRSFLVDVNVCGNFLMFRNTKHNISIGYRKLSIVSENVFLQKL